MNIQKSIPKYPGIGEQAFLDADHTKLNGIETAATKYPDTGEQAFLDADHTKLNGVESGATADQNATEIVNLINAGASLIDDNNIAATIARDSEVAAKISDTVYGAGWNGVTATAPSKNAIYDKIESAILWTDHTTYISPKNTRDITLTGSERFKMAGGIYAMTTGGTDFRILTTGSTAIGATSHGLARKSAWSMFATDIDNVDEMLVELNVIQRSGAGQRAKTGIKIGHYSQADNGGDVSGLLSVETGGGSAITCYKLHTLRPAGYTNYQDSEQGALECGTADQSQAGLFMSGMTTWGDHANAAECIWCRIDNEESKGILVTPNNETFDSRQAFAVGTINRNNSADGNLKFLIKLDGTFEHTGYHGMDNNKSIAMKNVAGTHQNMLVRYTDDTLRVGWGLTAGKLMMNIDGGLKTLSIDGNGFVKAT